MWKGLFHWQEQVYKQSRAHRAGPGRAGLARLTELPDLPLPRSPTSIKVSARVMSPASRGDPGRGRAKANKRTQQENGQEFPMSAKFCKHKQTPSAAV